ncbi:uncharacterized protein EI97DRAFT_445293 [Westerdykella ornata]|uniref:Uncharacterized protein n=1 Tax=Westerdykella ornata TaxID=318751 RepID=A0A6A6J9W1_WESOR|nr:uncharacterized protein EI97DRAFT_445293 [Westerdykella ornata]KAF2273014.1 hypothetical protein EI97DRAFT_445293 [Westerdykella ornata]
MEKRKSSAERVSDCTVRRPSPSPAAARSRRKLSASVRGWGMRKKSGSSLTTYRIPSDSFVSGKEHYGKMNGFERVFAAVAAFIHNKQAVTIDDVVEHLRKTQVLETVPWTCNAQRLLVFAILGWQSMLYRPTFNTCSLDELAVHQYDMHSNSGLVFDAHKVSVELSDRPLFALLKGFGNLLPAPSPNTAQVASENSKAAATWLALDPAETNAYLLQTLLHVQIRWVDCLALHLDYNKSERTLSLFMYPSFCLAALESHGAIYAFASTEKKSFDPRANEHDISQFMREVLLSYRLLFGQHGPSRKLFKHTLKPAGQTPDELLSILCMEKNINQTLVQNLPLYISAQHFPVLSERIELIATDLKTCRPSSMGQLLLDRRDKLQYWTFWLVSILGGISIVLSFIQVVLQGFQLAKG